MTQRARRAPRQDTKRPDAECEGPTCGRPFAVRISILTSDCYCRPYASGVRAA